MKALRTPLKINAAASIAVLLTLLAGCGGPKGVYPAAAEAQQRLTAEMAATQKSAASIDTQATYLKLVEQMQQDGLWFASLAHIDALEQRWGVSPESSRVRADALRQTGELTRSAESYKRLIGTPLEGAGYHGLGLLAGARGDYPDAVRLLKEAQRRSPTDAVLLSDLGYASLRAGLVAEARLPLMQALQLKSDNLQAQANLALYLEVTQQRTQAEALMELNRMPPAARAAIRDAAKQLGRSTSATGAPAAIASVSPMPGDDGSTPLLLKTSRRPGMGQVQAAGPANAPLSAPSATTPPGNPTSQGTP